MHMYMSTHWASQLGYGLFVKEEQQTLVVAILPFHIRISMLTREIRTGMMAASRAKKHGGGNFQHALSGQEVRKRAETRELEG